MAAVDFTSLSLSAGLAQLCRAQNVNAILLAVYSWSGKMVGASSDHVIADVQILLSDCHAQLILSERKHQEADVPVTSFSDTQSAFTSAVSSAADDIFAEWRSEIANNPTAIVNLVRYGFAIGTGQRTAGVTLGAGKSGASVTSITTFGTAEIAGLRRFDLITKLNGESLVGSSQPQLDALLAKAEANGGKYDVEVVRADGKTVNIHYKSETIAWYLRQPSILNASRKGGIKGVQNAAFVASIGGTYVGPVQDSSAGNGTLQLSLIQTHGAFSGTWGVAFGNAAFDSSGTLWGSVSGGRMALTLKPLAGGSPCVVSLSGISAKDQISGSYRSDSCPTEMTGTFQVRQQALSVPNIGGLYSGTIADNGAGSGTFTVTISQNGTNLSGTWAASFPDRRFNNFRDN